MPLDPLAKRLLTMMAAAAPAERRQPTTSERRASLAKLMQFARWDASNVSATDGVLPGPGGDIARLRLLPWRRHGGRQHRDS